MINPYSNPLFTVVYYSSNRERPEFEKVITDKLKAQCDAHNIQIISVSHKPMDLGENICVGDVGLSDHNVYRQIQLGCQAATTPFVISAESDCLYPADYFEFLPTDPSKFYRYGNVWILYRRFDYYFQKSSSECALITGRENYIKHIDQLLQGREKWSVPGDTPLKNIFDRNSWEVFGEDKLPVINVKSGRSMRQFTNTLTNFSTIDNLPYWGKVSDLKKELGL